MRAFLSMLVFAAVVACGGRKVEVRTGAIPDSGLSVHVTNGLSQAVNVYVVSGGQDIFLRQVPANSAEHLPVQGVSSGATVTLKATPVDGSRTYRSDPMVLTGMKEWRVP